MHTALGVLVTLLPWQLIHSKHVSPYLHADGFHNYSSGGPYWWLIILYLSLFYVSVFISDITHEKSKIYQALLFTSALFRTVFSHILWGLEITQVSLLTSFLIMSPNTVDYLRGEGRHPLRPELQFHFRHCHPLFGLHFWFNVVASILAYLYQLCPQLLCDVASKLSKASSHSSDQKRLLKNWAQIFHLSLLVSAFFSRFSSHYSPSLCFTKSDSPNTKLISCSVSCFYSSLA